MSPLLFPFSYLLLLIMTSYGKVYLIGQFGSAVLPMSYVLSQPLATPSFGGTVGNSWGVGFEETALMLCEHCLVIAKTLVCCQHCSSYKAQPYEGCYGES